MKRATAKKVQRLLREAEEPVNWRRVQEKAKIASDQLKILQKDAGKQDADSCKMTLSNALLATSATLSYLGYSDAAELVHKAENALMRAR